MPGIKFHKLEGEKFNLENVLLGGQTFSWDKIDQQTFLGVVGQKAIVLRARNKEVFWQTFPQQDDKEFVGEYFQVQQITPIDTLEKDPILNQAIKKVGKLRILKQPKEYTLITFILSANNNIGNIKRIVRKLAEVYGEPIKIPDIGIVRLFPTMPRLAQCTTAELARTGMGFRTKYVLAGARQLTNIPQLLENIALADTQTQRQRLREFYGVGEKIAECVRGFGFGMGDASPIDIWIKRILKEKYNVAFKNQKNYMDWFSSRFGSLSLYANQYLFEGYRG